MRVLVKYLLCLSMLLTSLTPSRRHRSESFATHGEDPGVTVEASSPR